MAEVLLFHHALGLTPGCLSLAERIRAAGHVVHTPDLYDGHTFGELSAGLAHAKEIGFDEIAERGHAVAEALPSELVYVGLSMGVMSAQMLAQTRPGATGAVLLHACIPAAEFGGPWPVGVPLQIHTMDDDEWGDLADARQVAAATPGAELFVYPGDRHLFTDDSLPDHDASAAALVEERVLELLDRVGGS